MKPLVIPAMVTVVALGLTGCGGTGPGSSPSADPVRIPPTPSTVHECPPADELASLDTRDVVEIPAGAVGVRLCDLGTTGPVLAPPEELRTGVDQLVQQFNAAEPFDAESTVCTADAGPAYAMVFRYPDDTSVTVTSMLAGCRIVGGKFGGDALARTFVDLVEQSRAAAPRPTPEPVTEPCAGPRQSWVPVRAEDLVTISACADATATSGTRGTATPEQWAILSADLSANVAEVESFWFAGEAIPYVATDHHGQPQALERFDDQLVLTGISLGSPQQKVRVWRPSPESLAILDQLGG